MAKIPAQYVLGKRENSFGVEAVIERRAASVEIESAPVTLEELFVMMEKEAEAS